jgi:hypothetical protein
MVLPDGNFTVAQCPHQRLMPDDLGWLAAPVSTSLARQGLAVMVGEMVGRVRVRW